MVRSNVHQPCFPPQVLTGYYGKGLCEKCEKHKVPKELVSKKEEHKCSTDLRGHSILRGSTQSHFVWEGPMSTNLASLLDPWTTEEVYCGRWEM